MFLPKIAFRKPLLSGWVETFVACYWCRWKVQDMAVRVVFFILKLVRKFLSDGELNTTWNREKIAMSHVPSEPLYTYTVYLPSIGSISIACIKWKTRCGDIHGGSRGGETAYLRYHVVSTPHIYVHTGFCGNIKESEGTTRFWRGNFRISVDRTFLLMALEPIYKQGGVTCVQSASLDKQ